MMNASDLNLNLIYKATKDGFKAIDFHSKCDKKGPTICVIKSEHEKTFGGFTNLTWHSDNSFVAGEGKSFIFQMDDNTKHNCLRKENEIY